MKLTEENYVNLAEQAMKEICSERDKRGRAVNPVTTSKIRKLLSMTADIYNDVINSKSDKLSPDMVGRINYLKIRFIYEAGRDRDGKVRKLVEQADILAHIDEIKDDRKQYLLFSRYMEALVAYRKFLGGRDE